MLFTNVDKANVFSTTGFDWDKFCKKSLDTARLREENGSIKLDPLSLLKHCATEVVEATEAFSNANESKRESFENELGDIICCVALIAAQYNMDLGAILERCWKKNDDRAHMVGDKL